MKRTIKQQVMKTKTQLTALILILSVMFATNTFAIKRDIEFEEETYIDDISFNTEWVVYKLSGSLLEMEEEKYIDDIPFCTGNVVMNYNYRNAVSVQFKIEEDVNVDDFAFETREIVDAYNHSKTLLVDFYLDDEACIEDIPFDTYRIAKNHSKENNNNMFAFWK